MAGRSVLGVRTIRRRLSRFALTAIGIALGIGVFFAVLVTNATIDAGLEEMIGHREAPYIRMEAAAGFAAELPFDVVKRAARLPDVIDVTGWSGAELRIPNAPDDRSSLFVYGGTLEDGTAKAPPRQPGRGSDLVVDGTKPAEGGDEVGLSDGVARQLRVGLGDTIALQAPTGAVRLKVVQMSHRRDGRVTDDRNAWASFSTAARLSGKSADRIDGGNLRLAVDAEPSQWIADHAASLPEVRLVSQTIGDATLREAFEGPQEALAGLAAVALFVSGFLIFLTLSLSVAQASSVHGTLRAIGASRRQVRRVVLNDAVLLTVLAAPAGLAVGLGAAVGMIRVTRGIYELPHLPVTIQPFDAVIAIVVGIVVTFVSALLPAQRAAMVAPVVAIRDADTEQPGHRRLVLVAAVLLLLGGGALSVIGQQRIDVASFVILVGAVLAVPSIMPALTRLAGRATRRLARGVGTVGVLHLRKEPRRAANTVALVMVVLAMVFTAGAVHLSLRRNLVTTLSQRFPADLFVTPGATFDDALRRHVNDVAGVRATTELRFTRLIVQQPAAGFSFVTVIDPTTFFKVQAIPWKDGSDRVARAALGRSGTVAVPVSLAQRHGVRRGDHITLMAVDGPRRYEVIGVFKTFDSQSPIIAGSRSSGSLLGPDGGRVGAIAVAVKPGASVEAVKRTIETPTAGAARLFVQRTSDQKADFIEGQTAFFNIVYVFVLIAMVMGMLGVTNTLALAVLRRHREIGILRAVGTERRLLRRMATVEAATIALAALLLAVPLGLVLSATVLQAVADAIGLVVDYVFPWAMFGVAAAFAVVVAVVSSVVPGRRAARVDPARVLRFD